MGKITRKTYEQGLRDGYEAAVTWHKPDPVACLDYVSVMGVQAPPPFELADLSPEGMPMTQMSLFKALKALGAYGDSKAASTNALAEQIVRDQAQLTLNADVAIYQRQVHFIRCQERIAESEAADARLNEHDNDPDVAATEGWA